MLDVNQQDLPAEKDCANSPPAAVKMTALSLITIVLVLLLTAHARAAQDPVIWKHWTGQDASLSTIEVILGHAQQALDGISREAAEDTPEGRMRMVVERRITLLGEYQEQIRRRTQLLNTLKQQPELEARQRAITAQLQRSAPPALDQPVKPEALGELEEEAKAHRLNVETIKQEIADANTRTESLGASLTDLKARKQAAQQRAELLESELSSMQEGSDKERQVISIANARLDMTISDSAAALLQEEVASDTKLSQLRSFMLEAAQLRLERTEQQLAISRESLEARLAKEGKQLEEALATKLREAQTSSNPVQSFLAQWELKVAQVRNNISGIEPFQINLKRDIEDQEKRLAADQHELKSLKEQTARFGTGGRVGLNIRRANQHLDARRKAVRLAIKSSTLASLDEYRDRRFDIDETLFNLKHEWQTAIDSFPAIDQTALARQASALREEYRQLLNKERALLTEVIAQGDHLLSLQTDRAFTLEELGIFVHSKIFWIRDGEILGNKTFQVILNEIGTLWSWSRLALSHDTLRALSQALIQPVYLGNLLLAAGLLPSLLIWIRMRLRRLVQTEQGRATQHGILRATGVVLAAIVESLLLPLYLVLISWTITLASLPANTGTVAAGILEYLAVFSLFWCLNHAFLAPGALLKNVPGIQKESLAQLYRAIRISALAYLFLLLPWSLLSAAPFDLKLLPQLAMTTFMLVAAIVLYGLCRPSSALMHDLLNPVIFQRLEHWKGLWKGLLLFILLAIPILNLAAFSFAAISLARSLLLTLVTLFALPPLYQAVLPFVDGILKRTSTSTTPPPGEKSTKEEQPDEPARRLQAQRFLRLIFTLLTLYLVSVYWGINVQAWQALDAMQIYKVTVQGEQIDYVSIADLLTAIGILIVTSWLLRRLPGIYDLTIFPRFDLDLGLRYAIVTISRYGLFFIGFMLALSAIKLDLSRIGWLIAAMGVGLGFGLQEIVSNFVCGIILLVERPIRVGDLVTVGSVTGRVQRINIRATTIVNFDRQEVVVPNRSLITSEVTNWTLVDNITRLVIPIGVAYGSDIDKVRQILEEIVNSQPEALADPAPQVLFINHGESSLDYELRIFMDDPASRMIVLDRINEHINKAFAKHDIEIPFPQRDLHIRSTTVIPTRHLDGPGNEAMA